MKYTCFRMHDRTKRKSCWYDTSDEQEPARKNHGVALKAGSKLRNVSSVTKSHGSVSVEDRLQNLPLPNAINLISTNRKLVLKAEVNRSLDFKFAFSGTKPDSVVKKEAGDVCHEEATYRQTWR